MVSQANPTQAAPGALEKVRELLNTWLIPNDTREARDDLDDWLARQRVPKREAHQVRQFRDELRAAIEDPRRLEASANQWIERYRILPAVSGDRLQFVAGKDRASRFAVTVMEAIAEGIFTRLKACPDCRWVFYDNTRNGRKKWCMMNPAGPESRGCGNIAKARRHRSRVRSP